MSKINAFIDWMLEYTEKQQQMLKEEEQHDRKTVSGLQAPREGELTENGEIVLRDTHSPRVD